MGWLIWGTLFTDFFAANAGSATGVGRDSAILWASAVGNLALAALYTMAILKTGVSSVADGAKVAAITGFLVWLGVDFIHYAHTNLDTLMGEGSGFGAAFRKLEPDEERRAEVNAGYAWVFGEGVHKDNIYRGMERP